jgi:hypothetical protein
MKKEIKKTHAASRAHLMPLLLLKPYAAVNAKKERPPCGDQSFAFLKL